VTRVDHVEVTGLAGRKDKVTLNFHPSLNVIFGQNGRGKTSLLRIIDSALTNDANLLRGVAVKNATVRFYSSGHEVDVTRTLTTTRAANQMTISGNQVLINASGEVQVLDPASVERVPARGWTTSPHVSTDRFLHSFLSTSRLMPQIQSSAYLSYSAVQTDPDTLFARDLQRLWQSYTNTVLSQVRRFQDDRISDILGNIFFTSSRQANVDVTVEEAYRNVIAFLQRQGSKVRPTARNEERFKRRFVDDVNLRRVVLDIRNLEQGLKEVEEPRRRLEDLVNQFVGDGKHIEFRDQGIFATSGEEGLELDSFSSGEKHLLRILVETIRVGQGATILVDEPEISMHIDWQQRLLGTMQLINPHCQIIVATHSPEIMAFVPDEQIIEL